MYKKICKECKKEFLAPHIGNAYCEDCGFGPKKVYHKNYYAKKLSKRAREKRKQQMEKSQ